MTEGQKMFHAFIKNFDIAYCQYYVWKTLQNTEFIKTYKKNEYFWAHVMDALLFAYSAGLAKLTEKQNKWDDKVVSIFYLLEYELENSNDIIKKLKKLRNKVLFHHDLKTALNAKKFLSKLNLKYIDIENLFSELVKIIDKIAPNFSTSPNFQGRYEKMKKNCEKDTFDFVNQLI